MRLFGFLVLAAVLLGCARAPYEAPDPIRARVSSDGAAVSAEAARLRTFPRFGDADPVDWDRRPPQRHPVHGIDVSRWQQSVDWRAAQRAGVSFAFLKATEGGDVADPMFDTHRRGAQAAGVPWGAYHYYYFCRSAESQARWFIRNVPRGAPLPHVLDMEWTPHSKTCRLRPNGRTVRSEARKFLDMLEAHYGRRPIIYTTVDFHRDTGIGALAGTEFWLRSVAAHPQKTYPGARWTFWQYSGTGLVPGIEGEVDLNVFRGSPEAWVRWKTP
ncbi:glycoside hydrolase family 25 protein [Shimia sp. R10_1]|uniref:glycoside hydrolase family 25 protein n=1 Tax=Shimia sp. R10_1 TaxID=2821095 RepID=UPI001ADCD8AE|nr:GH25 family lysozyme [Shimia sp. R10_1]MBO9474561.1 glycoside hydrolase family 25 protein [Shimia sp. R10_1]